MARKSIPGIPRNSETALLDIIGDLSRRLDALETPTRVESTKTSNFLARAEQTFTVEASSAGLTMLLESPKPANRGKTVTVVQLNDNPIRIEALDGTVNGFTQTISNTVGTWVAISDGERGWAVNQNITSGGSGGSGGLSNKAYIIHLNDPSLPNAARATDTAEIDVTAVTGGTATWALRTASVVFSKLQDLTGLSILGRAAASTGVMAAITATAARQVLQVDSTGTTLQWGNPLQVQDTAVTLNAAGFHTLNLIDGTGTVAVGTDAGSGVASVRFNASNVPLTSLATQAADTFLGNFTASPASPQALAGSTVAGAGLTYTTGGILAVGSSTSITVNANDIQRSALIGDITALVNSNTTAFRTFAAKSVLANATNASAVPSDLAGSGAFQYLRVNSVNTALEWAVLDLAAFPPIASGTVLANVTAGSAVPTAHPLSTLAGAGLTYTNVTGVMDVGGSTSIITSASDIQRAAMTGDITAAQNVNVTAFRTFAAKSVLANATNASAVPTELAGSGAFQHLRVNSTNAALEWAVLTVSSPITLTSDTIGFDQTVALGNNARVAVSKNSGATVGTRRRINLIEGSNITLTVADDAVNEEVDVTIAASGGGGSQIFSALTVTANLGSANTNGFFDITGLAGLTSDTQVLIWTAIDTLDPTETEDQIVVSGIVTSSTTIRAYWRSLDGPVTGNRKFNYAVSGAGTAAIAVKDDGVSVLTAATALNFASGISAVNAGAAQADVELAGVSSEIVVTGLSGNLGTISIAGLKCGGKVRFTAMAGAWQVEGFTAPAVDGFWFYVVTQNSENQTFFNEDTTATAVDRIRLSGDLDAFGTGLCGVMYYGYNGGAANGRWRGILSNEATFKVANTFSTTLAATTNNLVIGAVNCVRIDLTGSQSLTGMVPTYDGQMVFLQNTDSTDGLTIVHDATSTAANRFYLAQGADMFMGIRAGMWFRYDGTLSRWVACSARDWPGLNVRNGVSFSTGRESIEFIAGTGIVISFANSGTEIDETIAVDETSAFAWSGWHRHAERAASPTVGAGNGAFWFLNQNPSVPRYTDDVEADWNLNNNVCATNTGLAGTSGTGNLTGATFNIPGDTLRVGAIYKIEGYLVFQRTVATTASNITVEIVLGGTSYASSTWATFTVVGTGHALITGYLTCLSIGAAGTFVANICTPADSVNLTTPTAAQVYDMISGSDNNSASATTQDTTTSTTILVRASQSAAVGSITWTAAAITRLNY